MRHPLKNYVTFTKFFPSHQHFLAAITKVVKPRFYHEAVQDAKWRQAMVEEINVLQKNGTWTSETLSSGKKPISCKWVYRVKYHSDGTIE